MQAVGARVLPDSGWQADFERQGPQLDDQFSLRVRSASTPLSASCFEPVKVDQDAAYFLSNL